MWIRVDDVGRTPGLGVEGPEHPWYPRDLGPEGHCPGHDPGGGQVRRGKASGSSWRH